MTLATLTPLPFRSETHFRTNGGLTHTVCPRINVRCDRYHMALSLTAKPSTLASEHNSSNCMGRTSSFRRVWSIVFAKAGLPTSGHGHGSSDTLMLFSTSERNLAHSALVYRAVMPLRLPSALFFSLPHSRERRIMITHTRHYALLRTLDPGRRRRPQPGWRWPYQRGGMAR